MLLVKVIYLTIAAIWFIYCIYGFRTRLRNSRIIDAIKGIILIWAMCMVWPISIGYGWMTER